MQKLMPLILGVVLLFCNTNLYSAIHIVDNNPGSTAQYTSIGAAFTAASAGDTIYVIGSVNPYGCFTWNKKITLIGPGHKPDKQNTLKAEIAGCGPNIYFRQGSDGSSIIGMYLGGGHSIWMDGIIHNITLKGNYLGGFVEIEGNNYLLENNIFYGSGANIGFIGTTHGNTLINKNIFNGYIQNAQTATTEIVNNIFLRNGVAFSGVSNVSVKNNIFHKANPTGILSANFENNITFQTTDTLPSPGNFGSGNINADPQFENVPSSAQFFNYSHDYNLKSTSPGKNAGTDGKDIGVYGGMGAFSMGGEPAIPIIKLFSIKNTIVPPNGNLEIKIEAETK